MPSNLRSYTIRNLKKKHNFFRKFSVTNWIIILNVIAFIGFIIFLLINEANIDYVAIKPSNILQGKYLWTFLTSMFMHANFTHIFVNMISLIFIGNFVEKLIGRKRFFWLYMISGIVAGLIFVLSALVFSADVNLYAVGASGAIFGLGGLLAILTPRLPVLVFFVIPMPMWAAMLFLMFGLWAISLAAGLPIGNWAHFGGLICGLAYGIYLKKKYKRKTRMISRYFR